MLTAKAASDAAAAAVAEKAAAEKAAVDVSTQAIRHWLHLLDVF